jgi:hypothetical protein
MSQNSTVECSICGLTGEPPAGCDVCHGGAPVQSRGYTLSEVRSGVAPKPEDRSEQLNPKASNLVVGGAINHPSHPQN